MTNTTYFYNTLREYYSSSVSSSCSDHHTPPRHEGEVVVKVEAAASSVYTAISKACLACARPPIEQEEDDNSSTATIRTPFLRDVSQQNTRTDEEESSQTLSSMFVFPISQFSTFEHFDFSELETATRNFDFGMDIAISVKVLNSEGFQDHMKWLEEVIYLGHVHHPNLVRLLGYCLEDTNRRQVYEFTSQGSLENLFEGPFPKVPWSLWLNLALDAAKDLAIIHSSNIVHGCFKPSNIILDANYSAKLLGSGLTKDTLTTFPIGVLETPNGDFGYAIDSATIYDAPEYAYTGHSSAKTDVYSFGVVFLEILFGRRAFGKFWPLEEQNLVEWIKSHPNLKPRCLTVLHSLTDRQLKSGENAVGLAIRCLSVEANLRPTMDEVVIALEELVNENNRSDAQNYRTRSFRFPTVMEV